MAAAPAALAANYSDLDAALHACKSILLMIQVGESNGATSSLNPERKGPRDFSSSIPRGASLRQIGPPSKDFSLYLHYHWRIDHAARAEDVAELRKLAALATRDWNLATGKAKRSIHEYHADAVSELIRDHEGIDAESVAWELGQDVRWVRRQRVLKFRDPETGSLRDDLDGRTRKAIEMIAAGKTQKEIAAAVGLSQSRISQIKNGTR